MAMIWNSGMGTPMPSATPEPGREYSPTRASGTFTYGAAARTQPGQYPNVPASLAPLLASKGFSSEEIQYWMEYVSKVADAEEKASGWEKIKLQAQREDAQKGLDNAITLERMRDQSSRYGTDAQTQTAMAQLEENQRQFDANHGLAVADSYTKYASTPDDLFQLQDLKGAVNAAATGGYQTPLAASPTQPHAKTWQDYAALAGYGPTAGAAGSGASATGQSQQGGGGSGAGGDKRLKAMRAVSEAMPPSDGMGHDQQDWAAIDAIKSLYFGGRPGDVESLDPVQQREAQSGLRRAGYNADQVVAQRRRSLPGQYAASAA